MNDAHRAVDGLRQAHHYIREQGRSYRVYQERMTLRQEGWCAASSVRPGPRISSRLALAKSGRRPEICLTVLLPLALIIRQGWWLALSGGGILSRHLRPRRASAEGTYRPSSAGSAAAAPRRPGLTVGPVPPRVPAGVNAGLSPLDGHAPGCGWPARRATAALGLDHARSCHRGAGRLEDPVLLGQPPRDPVPCTSWPDWLTCKPNHTWAYLFAHWSRARCAPPQDQAWTETLLEHAKREWPHREKIRDPGEPGAGLNHVQPEYTKVRLHASIGYVPPTTSTKTAAMPSVSSAAAA
jgi:hypothetical protein